LEQLHDIIRNFDVCIKGLNEKIHARQIELRETNEKIESMQKVIDDLKETISTQELSVDDAIKIENETKGYAEAVERLQVSMKKKQQALLECDHDLIQHVSDCEAAVAEFNIKQCDVLGFSNSSSAFAGTKLALNKDNLLSDNQKDFLGVCIKTELGPAMQSAQMDVAEKSAALRNKYQVALDRLGQIKQSSHASSQKRQIIQDKITRELESFKQEQDVHEAKLSVLYREVETTERAIDSLRTPMDIEEQAAVLERQLAEIEAIKVEHRENNLAKKKAVMDEMDDALNSMLEHEQFIKQTLAEVAEYRAQKKANLPTIVVPPNLDLE
jgi:chromosome segregation ATPase